MLEQPSLFGGGVLEKTQTLLAQVILILEDKQSSQTSSDPSSIESSPNQTESTSSSSINTSSILRNLRIAVYLLSQTHLLLFGKQPSDDGKSISRWISQNQKLLSESLEDKSNPNINKILAAVLSDEASCGEDVIEVVKDADAESSPPQPCDILLPYQPSLNFNQELKTFRHLVERRFESIPSGIPRHVVEKVAALEILFYLTRDRTTDPIWNVDHQVSRKEVFGPSDVGKVFRQKCVCVAEKDKEAVHSTDPHCPKNKKDEDTPAKVDAKEEKAEAKKEEEKKEEEKPDPSEKIHSRELMAEILDMIGPQHVKDHFRKIKDMVSASYKETNPWENKYFGVVLMGPASTGKDKIAKRYGKYLISCGVAKENRIEREASYIIENDKLEDYFKRLDDGGVLTIENAHLLLSYKHKDKLALNYLLEMTEKKKGKITLILHGEEPELREFLSKHPKTPLFPHVLALNEFKGEDALTILRSGMENWFGEKTQVEGGWDGLYMRIAARRIAKKKDVDVTEEVGTLVKSIHSRQRKRINEARKARGEEEKKVVRKSSNRDLKGEKPGEDAEKEDGAIIPPEGAPSGNPVEGDKAKAKSQDVAAASPESEDIPKTQSRASTMSISAAPAVTTSVVESEKSSNEITPEKLKSAEEVQTLLKQTDAEVPETTEDNQDSISTGQSTPRSETEDNADALATETPAPGLEKKLEVAPEQSTPESKASTDKEEPLPASETVVEESKEEKPKESTEEQKPGTAESKPEAEKDAKVETPVETAETPDKTETEKTDDKPKDTTESKDEAKDDASSDSSDSDNDSTTSDESAATDITTPDKEDDPEDYTFTKDDILGPAPSNKVLESESWKKLQKLTGLKKVKESLLNFLELAKANYNRELQEKPLLEFTFNRLFLGPPGTGKTLVAKLYGQILAEIGVLSKGELIVKNASDLIGKYIGDSETNTKEALKEANGNVLVIDEAYMLYTSDGVTNTTDCFRQGIIDTLVGGIQNVPGEDRCVLLLGYEEQMKNFLTESNPGLIRRFPLEDAFTFEEFSLPELKEILLMKLGEYGLDASPDAIKTAMSVLDKQRSRMNFGNGGAVENLITKAKSACLSRIIALPEEDRPDVWTFEPRDFDPEFDRVDSATSNLQKLFSDVVGCEDIIEKFENYQLVCQAMKERDMDPKGYIPTNFIFKGPPGTGKTTTARKIAQIYYDMGFLSEATVVECSVTDLIGSYIGQTGPKTTKALERGLGKVLFIDEAYRLAEGGRGSFATEAVSELVDCLTKPKFFGKIIVILAGYEDEMNALLAMNPGLASRFPEEIMFDLLPPAGCLEVLQKKLAETNIAMPLMDGDENSYERQQLERLLRNLSQTPSWGNARDVETLAKNIARKIFVNGLLEKKKKAEPKKKEAEGLKKPVNKPAQARPNPEKPGAKKEEVKVEEVQKDEEKKDDEKKDDEKKDEEKKEDEKKPEEVKKLECDLATATTAMEEMLAERKARDGSGVLQGFYI